MELGGEAYKLQILLHTTDVQEALTGKSFWGKNAFQ